MTAIHTVLCPVDFTPLSDQAVQLAATLASRLESKLVLHHNLAGAPPGFLSVRWMWSEEHRQADAERSGAAPERLRRLLAELPESLAPEARLSHGPLADSLIEVAERLPADLLVMASHGRSTPQHESITERVVPRAPCPVLTVAENCEIGALFAPRPGRRPQDFAFVLPIDFSDGSLGALAYASDLARHMPHRMHLVHVVPPSPALDDPRVRKRTVEERVERLTALVPSWLTARTVCEVREGDPAREILRAAEDSDAVFIVMPARRSGLMRRALFGDTTTRVLHESRWPVWFVPEGLAMPLLAAGS